MKIRHMLLISSLICAAAGCGDEGIPNMAGPWNLSLTPHAQSSSTPLPGVSLGVTFIQSSETLSGNVTSVNNQSQACLQGLSASNVTVSGRVGRPGDGDVPPLNLSLTITFTPAGASSATTVTATGGIPNGAQNVDGLYEIQGASTDCLQGQYTLTRAGR